MLGRARILHFSFFGFLACVGNAWAIHSYQAGVIPFGMGGAYSAAADDWLSLYYNPAGLALVRKVEFQPFDLVLGSNSDVVNAYKDVKVLGHSSSNLANTLNSFAGKKIEGNLADYTQLTIPYFALGLSYQTNLEFNLQNVSYPTTKLNFTRDLAFSVGGAFAVGKRDDFRMGVRLAMVNRTGGNNNVDIVQIMSSKSALLNTFTQNATGTSGTLGMQYRLPIESRTEVNTSFVWHDIGDTTFGSYGAKSVPTRIDSDMVAGAAVRIPIGGRQNRRLERRYGPKRSTNALTFAYDYSELAKPWNQRPFLLHSHLGMNLDLPILSIQVGMYQNSLSFGTGFDIGLIKVAFATYAEEMGFYPGQDRDRRYLLSIGNSFSFGKF